MEAEKQVETRFGLEIEVIPEDEEGDIDLRALEAACRRGPCPALIAITHTPTSSGAALPRSQPTIARPTSLVTLE